MGKSSPPTPPNPTETANAQSTSNVNTAAAQAALNYTNQNTPYGSTSYQQTGSYQTPNGETVPTYTQNTSLSPLGQQLLTGEQTIGASLMPGAWQLGQEAQASATKPLDFNTPFSGTLNQGPQLLNQNVTNALYGQQKGFLDPQWEQQQQQLQDQLSRQGIGVGSEAYGNAEKQFDNARTQAYQSAQDSAIGAGTAASGNLFNMALSGQQQNVGQQQLAEQQPISLLGQLLGVTPSTPSQPIATPVPTQISPTDVIGATGLSSNAAMNAYQAQLGSQNATFGGLASLGGAGIMAVAL